MQPILYDNAQEPGETNVNEVHNDQHVTESEHTIILPEINTITH